MHIQLPTTTFMLTQSAYMLETINMHIPTPALRPLTLSLATPILSNSGAFIPTPHQVAVGVSAARLIFRHKFASPI